MSALQLNDLAFSFGLSAPPVFSNINLTIQKGARVVLVGANGAGKTTLLNVIGGKRKPSCGAATVLGHDSFEYTPLSLKMNLVTSNWDEDLTLPVKTLVGNAIKGAHRSRVQALADALGIAELMHAELADLSDGQRRRVQLFCKLVPMREVVLLDEATNSLDVLCRAALLSFLHDESELRGATIVFCTHIFDGLDGWATELVHLDNKALHHHVKAEELPAGQSLYQVVSGWLKEQAPAVGADITHPAGAALLAELLCTCSDTPPVGLKRSREQSPVDPSEGSSAPARATTPVKSFRDISSVEATERTTSPAPAAPAALPPGWGDRSASSTAGAFGEHTWTAGEDPGVGTHLDDGGGHRGVKDGGGGGPEGSGGAAPAPVQAVLHGVGHGVQVKSAPMEYRPPGEAEKAPLPPPALQMAPTIQGALGVLASRVDACKKVQSSPWSHPFA